MPCNQRLKHYIKIIYVAILVMNITQDLAYFYTTEAKKYHQTRKKYRPDGQLLLQKLQAFPFKHPKILELGCGGGRFISLLNQSFKKKFSYIWIDISEGLLSYAKEENPDQQFFCSDMLSFLQSCKQESFDSIVACASFQHLATDQERLAVLKNAYRALKYDGVLIFTNWAFSERFLNTHWKVLLWSLFKVFLSFGKQSWRDVFIPRKTKTWVHYRYYHLFWLDELKKLAEMAWFVVEELYFLDKKGEKTDHWRYANNSFLIARKLVFKR